MNERNEVLSKWLLKLNYTSNNLIDNIKAFQRDNNLVVDGIAGPITLRHLSQKLGPYSLVTTTVDLYNKSGSSFTLRSDASNYFRDFYKEIKNNGGVVTSAGSLRALNAPVSVGRSATSLHYLSVAFDLSTISGMVNPETDPYVIELNKDGYWTVWCRSDKGELRTINNPYTYITYKTGTRKPITDKFINFTEIAKKYGFMPVKPWSTFFTTGSMMTAEWWHFQNEWCLMPQYSTLGEELQKVYTRQQLENTPPMRFANVIWKVNWFG
jgi:hypothetical protein